MLEFTVKKLAAAAGISVRTLHYYDQVGLLKPDSHSQAGYRLYSETSLLVLQQILFFRELGFSLDEIKKIMSSPDYHVVEALQSHRELLLKQQDRLRQLIQTVDRTIGQLKGENKMTINEYYQGFSREQIEKYRSEAKERWGEKTIQESEARVMKMGKTRFTDLQAEGGRIFKAVADNMDKGPQSSEVQALIARWRQWLENFSQYSSEAVLGLGQMYSQHPDFITFYQKIHPDLPQFLTRAIEYYCSNQKTE